MRLNPRRIPGCWDDGFALDVHTTASEFLGHDEYGNPQFETTRSEIGELVYQLKYRNDRSALGPIASAVCDFVRRWRPGIDLIVSAPPSRQRPVQPLFELAEAVGKLLGLPVDLRSVRKVAETPELKNVYEYSKRLELLEGAHAIEGAALRGRRVLLLDDLYRSGATLNTVARLMKETGGAAAVFVLTLTRTRTST